MPKIKKQTVELRFAQGTAAGQYTKREQLDAQMNKAVGYALYENSHPNAPYRIRVEDDDQVYQQLTNYQDYLAKADTDKNGRYSPCDIPAKTNYVTITVQIFAPLPAALDGDFVFLLQD